MTISGVAADPPNAIVWRGIGWISIPARHSAWYAARSAAVKVAVPDSERDCAQTWARTSVPEPVFSKPTEPRISERIVTVFHAATLIVGTPLSPKSQMRLAGESQFWSTWSTAELVTTTYAVSPGAGSPGIELAFTSSWIRSPG